MRSLTSAVPVHCSNRTAIRPNGSWSLCGLIKSLQMMDLELYITGI